MTRSYNVEYDENELMDELNELDPNASSPLIFDGTDRVAAGFGDDDLCSLYVLGKFPGDNGSYIYYVRTNSSHGDITHPYLTLTVDLDSTTVVGLGNSDKDRIQIVLGDAGNLDSIQSYKLSWFHVSHYHHVTCLTLAKRVN